jgi:uncharacterized membrane protein
MNTTNQSNQLEKTGAIAGIVSILFYFMAAVVPYFPDYVSRLLGFTFPLLWIISFMGLYQYLKREKQTSSLEIAYLFGIIGAAIACSFIVVQQANFMWHESALEAAKTDDSRSLLTAAFRGANRVQAGLDVAFDIFITISWFLFGLNIAKSKNFNRILGWSGSLIALGLLVLNLITFPNAPAESGLFDLGPFLGLWALLFYIWFSVKVFKSKSSIR